MAGRWVRYQRLYRRSSSTYSHSQLFSVETKKANYFYLMMLMARIVIGVVWGSVGKHIRQLAIEYLPEAPLAPCLDHPPTFRWGGRWWRNDGNGSQIVTRCHWIFCEDITFFVQLSLSSRYIFVCIHIYIGELKSPWSYLDLSLAQVFTENDQPEYE